MVRKFFNIAHIRLGLSRSLFLLNFLLNSDFVFSGLPEQCVVLHKRNDTGTFE